VEIRQSDRHIKYGQIRLHIWWPNPAGAGYDMISGATLFITQQQLSRCKMLKSAEP